MDQKLTEESSVGSGMVAGISPKNSQGDVDPIGPAGIDNAYTRRNRRTTIVRRNSKLSFKDFINGS
jgi:hypothetical protein